MFTTRIYMWALTADAAIGLGLLMVATGRRLHLRLSILETMILVVFALGFLWANSRMWFGIQHLLQNAPWIDRGNETVVYGFPFSRRAKPFDSQDFIFELKIDGWRALAVVEAHKCNLVSRNGNVFSRYSEVRTDLQPLRYEDLSRRRRDLDSFSAEMGSGARRIWREGGTFRE